MQKGNRVNSERIKEARLFRKMTMADLAESVGINKQAISQFENNKTTPEPLTLHKISEALDFPYSFFLEYDNPSTIGNTYFRALYSSKKKDLVAQKIRAKYLVKIHSVLSTKVKFKPLNLPVFTENEQLSIEEIAQQVRTHWDLGDAPIPNMVSLLEKNGIIV